MRVASAQIAYRFGDQLYYPYSIAALVSYVSQFEAIKDNYEFLPCLVEREHLDAYAEQYSDADILLCSCYLWNVEATTRLMREFRKCNPAIVIIAGGPNEKGISEADLNVVGEGEQALSHILMGQVDARAAVQMPAGRMDTLDHVPSPYLDGTMHRLVDPQAAKWIATWETMRGCPYRCGYCAWGDPAYNDLRQFPLERLNAEIDWFIDNHIEYIECADANFGIFPRDEDLAQRIAARKNGYPKVFKPSWAKQITPRVFRIARTLKEAGLLLSAGCSLQSLEPAALKEVKRVNVGFDQFKDTVKQFHVDGIHTFTELIRGLPGETLDSFRDGLNKVVFESDIDTVYVYNCTVLPGTALAARDDIETVRSPLYLAHACVGANEEYENIVVASSTFSRDDIREMYLYSWYMLAFQHLGILNYVTRYLVREQGITYMEFWRKFEEYCQAHPDSLFGKEYAIARQYIENGYSGKGWGHVDAMLGPITYPLDEATWLRVTRDRIDLTVEIDWLLGEVFSKHYWDLARFQVFMLSSRDKADSIGTTCGTDWLNYFKGGALNERLIDYIRPNKITAWQDDFDWNRQAIWYGRRKLAYKATIEEVREI